MAPFDPFMKSKKAQTIIDDYLDGNFASTPNVNSAGVFRNPVFDLRTEQENAGTLDPSALYPNPQLDFSVPDTPVDPCPPGYQLIDGVCQPMENFGQSAYDENTTGDGFVDDRKYMSIDDMRNASDEELLEYLKDGFLSNSTLGFLPSKGSNVTLKGGFMPAQFQLLFGKQNQMRQDFIKNELMKRGYFTGNFDNNQNPIFNIANKNINPMQFNSLTGGTNEGIESMLPANTGGPVTDVFGDTYQQVYNTGTGDIGYTFTSANPQDPVANVYNNPNATNNTTATYGTGRGGTSDNQMTGGGTVIIGGNPFGSEKVDDYDDDSSGI
tara:strand:+ start:248 stop:1222 length:975 start_codon:yes stop_codon:yes gene_type:complete